jgi:spermidine synthase
MILFETKTPYHHIRIVEKNSVRKMMFGDGWCAEQSGINLVNPSEHVFDYSFMAMHSLLFMPCPSKVLVVGLGGAVIPMEMSKCVSEVHIDILELDPEVLKLSETYFNFRQTKKMKVYLGDAFLSISKLQDKYDIVIIDAFTTDGMPFHLKCIEFFRMLYVLMSDGGIIAINSANTHYLFNSQINTLYEIFGNHLYILNGLRNPHSSMLFALKGDGVITKTDNSSFLTMIPKKITITENMKKTTIFSLGDTNAV